MKKWIILGLGLWSQALFADSLPVFTSQPSTQTVAPNVNVTFVASATGASSYQWRHNGVDIPWGTGPTLQLTNVQATDTGYYLAVAKNAVGWVPSQMAYLAVVASAANVPLSNTGYTNSYNNGEVYPLFGQIFQGYTGPLTNGTARVMAGPELDQMQLVTGLLYKANVSHGRYSFGLVPGTSGVPVANAESGQQVYYSVYVNYTNSGTAYTQQSTVIKIPGIVSAVTTNLIFPQFLEWPGDPMYEYGLPTQYVATPGETVTLTGYWFAYADFGAPTAQWRLNGGNLRSGSGFAEQYSFGNFVTSLSITNVQPEDAGVYDSEIFGNNWIPGPKIYLSVQTTNGAGVFQTPKFDGTNFVCNFAGAISRTYQIQWSTNLVDWNNLMLITNTTGSISLTNSAQTGNSVFYRSQLLP